VFTCQRQGESFFRSFSTFFGAHEQSWAVPEDQYTWFQDFGMSIQRMRLPRCYYDYVISGKNSINFEFSPILLLNLRSATEQEVVHYPAGQ